MLGHGLILACDCGSAAMTSAVSHAALLASWDVRLLPNGCSGTVELSVILCPANHGVLLLAPSVTSVDRSRLEVTFNKAILGCKVRLAYDDVAVYVTSCTKMTALNSRKFSDYTAVGVTIHLVYFLGGCSNAAGCGQVYTLGHTSPCACFFS